MIEKSKTENKTFYYLEVSQEAYDLLRSGCKTIEQLMCGNLGAVQDMAFAAYQKRTGEAVSPEMQHQIKDCIKGLESWGWNRPLENPSRFSDESDTFRDIFDVLDHQQAILGNDSQSEGIPPHYNKNITQIRVIDIVESSQKRIKQLKAFVDRKTKRRRI